MAIADVSHYVRAGMALDDEAYERGTSVYYPNFVCPMFPEALSNELCSLKPKVDRLALVAEMIFDHEGQMKSSEFYEAVIHSHARVTYGQAQDIIEGESITELDSVSGQIRLAGDLAKILMEKRFKDGSLDMDIPESIVELSDAGVPLDIVRSERLFAHRLIEELMLVANIAVARFLGKKQFGLLYRIHEPPKEDALETLRHFLKVFGYKKNMGSSRLQKKLTQAIKFFADKPEAPVVNMLVLRSLAQAQYNPENVGHFGLGFEDYAHFTSPIRRYPDLIVHRVFKSCQWCKGL